MPASTLHGMPRNAASARRVKYSRLAASNSASIAPATSTAWCKAAGIDPVKVARQLWRQTRLDDRQKHYPPDPAARPQTRSIARR
jgi:hypothetical protein